MKKASQLQYIPLSTEMMDASQISLFIDETSEQKTYTSFEVYPNKNTINAGDIDPDTGITYIESIDPCTTAVFTLYSQSDKTNCNIIVDWGDGQQLKLCENNAEIIDFSGTEGKYTVIIQHDYANSITTSKKKFIVKIYGSDCYCIRGYKKIDSDEGKLISRIFDSDLRVSPYVRNFSSACFGNKRLQRIINNVGYFSTMKVANWGNCFNGCKNLVLVKGLKTLFQGMQPYTVFSMFANCENLEESDVVLPPQIWQFSDLNNKLGEENQGYYNFYGNCKKLKTDIIKLLPQCGFAGNRVYLANVFSNCISLPKSISQYDINGILDPNCGIKYGNSTTMVRTASPAIRRQVNANFGGEYCDNNIKIYLKQVIGKAGYIYDPSKGDMPPLECKRSLVFNNKTTGKGIYDNTTTCDGLAGTIIFYTIQPSVIRYYDHSTDPATVQNMFVTGSYMDIIVVGGSEIKFIEDALDKIVRDSALEQIINTIKSDTTESLYTIRMTLNENRKFVLTLINN